MTQDVLVELISGYTAKINLIPFNPCAWLWVMNDQIGSVLKLLATSLIKLVMQALSVDLEVKT